MVATIASSANASIQFTAVYIESLKTPFADRPKEPLWRVWNTIEALLSEGSNVRIEDDDDDDDDDQNNDQNNITNNHCNSNPMMQEPYRTTTVQVASILQKWAFTWAGQKHWTSVLHKRKLLHEVEESIVALYHLHQWMCTKTTTTAVESSPVSQQQQRQQQPQPASFIAVDVCGGKGLFSLLLSYMASEFWYVNNPTTPLWALEKIILLENATNVKWDYIEEANERVGGNAAGGGTTTTLAADSTVIPQIEIWANTNLHNYDDLLTRFQKLCKQADATDNVPLALSGIHLCKMLSPSLINLANGLGPVNCPYLCLAPCCMPRMVTSTSQQSCRTIPIQLYETPDERFHRMDHNRRKLSSRRGRTCFLCHSKQHWVRKCPQMQGKSIEEQDDIVARAAAKTPCWNCGVVGHLKPDCPTPEERIKTMVPPTIDMDISQIYESKTEKYEKYCKLLAEVLETSSKQRLLCQPVNSNYHQSEEWKDECYEKEPMAKKPKNSSNDGVGFKTRVVESGLTTSGSHPQEGNWNSRRKSIFIVATR